MYVYIYLAAPVVNTRVHNYRSTSQRFLRRAQNQTSDDVAFPPRTFFYTISPHDISFLIVDSTTSNRVNRLFFLAAFHSAVTFNFLRVVVIAVFKRRTRTCTTVATCMESFAHVYGYDIDTSVTWQKTNSTGQK